MTDRRSEKAIPANVPDVLAALGPVRDLQPGDELVLPGGGGHICVATHGLLFVRSTESRRVLAELLYPGDVFLDLERNDTDGENGMVAVTQARLVTIPVEVVVPLLASRPDVGIWFLKACAVRIRRAEDAQLDMMADDIESRLARVLIDICRLLGTDRLPTRGRRRGGLSQENLGELIGTSRVTVNRTIKKLQLEGVLVHEGGTLVVKDLDALARCFYGPRKEWSR